jgi:predicted ATPase/DNA-binding winged helix-turn-helix (wHTH) protein
MPLDDNEVRPRIPERDVVSFGPFTLIVGERILTKQGAAVPLGAKTLDTLIALISRPNEVLTKRALLIQVWPDVIVEEGSVRVQIANLRRALGDGEDGARYIATVAGRGYCFVAPVTRSTRPQTQIEGVAPFSLVSLPNPLTRIVGRSHDIRLLSDQLTARRFVTVVGSGGVGKTTVALAVAHSLSGAFDGAVGFVDLGALAHPDLVAPTVASVLGLTPQSDDPLPSLIAHLRNRRALLVLDTCEHLLDAVAALTARLLPVAMQVHILATSREAVRVHGEHVFKLDSLTCPPEDPELTAAIARTFPAVELFVERALASDARFDLTDGDAATVAGICRKLDGVPLAIELAAGRVGVYGLHRTAALLDQRLSRLWQGQRTAPPRQKTLQATLDWSYGLLSETERTVLQRLSIFVGSFTIEQALAVVITSAVDESLLFGVIDSLIGKSMVAATPSGAMMRYRLLDATRAYALEMRNDERELHELAARHASYYLRWLEGFRTAAPSSAKELERTPDVGALANVRAALEWCFSASGDEKMGVGIAAAAAPHLFAAGLFSECCRWTDRALRALDSLTRGTLQETALQVNLGMSLMVTRGSSEQARVALDRGLTIAEACGDNVNQLSVLHWLHRFHVRANDCRAALHYAQLTSAVAHRISDPAAIALAHYLSGYSFQLSGNLNDSRVELEAALAHAASGKVGATTPFLGRDDTALVATALARTLWLQGYPTQAVMLAEQAVRDAEITGRPLTRSIALISLVTLLLWTGDLEMVAPHVERFAAHAQSYSLGPYRAVAHGLKGQLAVQSGAAQSGVESLQQAVDELHAAHYEVLTTPFNISLVQALTARGRVSAAITLADAAIRLIQINGDFGYMPELLRVKALVLLAGPQSDRTAATECLSQSLEMSRRMDARGWELRAAVELASLLLSGGKPSDAKGLLQQVFDRFTEGHETMDLKIAQRLLAKLSQNA